MPATPVGRDAGPAMSLKPCCSSRPSLFLTGRLLLTPTSGSPKTSRPATYRNDARPPADGQQRYRKVVRYRGESTRPSASRRGWNGWNHAIAVVTSEGRGPRRSTPARPRVPADRSQLAVTSIILGVAARGAGTRTSSIPLVCFAFTSAASTPSGNAKLRWNAPYAISRTK